MESECSSTRPERGMGFVIACIQLALIWVAPTVAHGVTTPAARNVAAASTSSGCCPAVISGL
jgi:hypothetical protein